MTAKATKRIKILHLTYNMGIGGTEQVIYQLVKNADNTVFENVIVCLDGEVGPIGQQLQNSGTQFHLLNRVPGFDIGLINSVRKLIQSGNIDIVHCHQYTPYVYGVLAALFTRAQVVFTEHGRFHPDRYSWKRRLINPLLELTTSSIVAISAATKEALAEFEWFQRDSIEVIYNGIETPTPTNTRHRNELKLTDEHIVFGTITRFDTIKNLPMMVRAFAKTHRMYPNAVLLLVGDGDQKPAIENMVEELGVNQAVIFTGFQTDTQKFMSMIDVYILSSFSEGTSMTLLEAMSLSICCVVTAVGGNVELIQNEVNGLVVESDNVQQLSDALIQLIDDEKTRVQLGVQAQKTFERNFALTQMIQSYCNVYLKITEKS